MRKRIIILLLIPILWTSIIFGFSLQPAEISSDLSGGFGRWIVETFQPEIWEKFEEMPAYELEMWHTVLRKCAHFAEYFVLGVLWMAALRSVVCRRQKLVAIGLCALTASVDEIIQRFVPGRSGQFQDVLLDSIGAVVGVCLFCVIKLGIVKFMDSQPCLRKRSNCDKMISQ